MKNCSPLSSVDNFDDVMLSNVVVAPDGDVVVTVEDSSDDDNCTAVVSNDSSVMRRDAFSNDLEGLLLSL